ncbi:MAG: hypothetical protein RR740_00735 [Pseudomonas sp.]
MFYLVLQSVDGHRLVDYSDKAEDLTPQIKSLIKDHENSTPVVMTDKVLSRTYLVDKFGIPAQGLNGLLTEIEDLV